MEAFAELKQNKITQNSLTNRAENVTKSTTLWLLLEGFHLKPEQVLTSDFKAFPV